MYTLWGCSAYMIPKTMSLLWWWCILQLFMSVHLRLYLGLHNIVFLLCFLAMKCNREIKYSKYTSNVLWSAVVLDWLYICCFIEKVDDVNINFEKRVIMSKSVLLISPNKETYIKHNFSTAENVNYENSA